MKRILLYLLLVSFLGTACNPTRKLAENEKLLLKTKVKTDQSKYNDELKAIIKQKPNRKMLGILRFNLGVYNLFANTDEDTLNWISRTVGEPPVVLDTVLTERTSKQMSLYMQNRGYFNSVVKDSTWYRGKNDNKAIVLYKIKSKIPYTIRELNYNVVDTSVAKLIEADKKNSLLKLDDNFDSRVMQLERNRITNMLKNFGYYFFNQEYITFRVDSSLKNHQVKLFMDVAPETVLDEISGQPLVVPHSAYYLNNIYIRTDYDPLRKNIVTKLFSKKFNDYTFVSADTMQYNHCILSQHMFLNKGGLYKLKDLEKTYEKLADLGVFKFINIELFKDTTSDASSNLLNANVYLTPRKKQDYSFEIEGTRSGSDFGISGNVVYRNKNTFKGAELMQIKLRGSVEATRSLSQDDTKLVFNTYEIGPEVSLTIPKLLLPFTGCKKTKNANAFTVFSTNYNLENRPEFRRTIANLSAGFGKKLGKYWEGRLYFADLNFVDVSLSDNFRDLLNNIGDQSLIDQFEDHLIPSTRLSVVFNNQKLGRNSDFLFFRTDIEFAGNALSWINEGRNADLNADGKFEVLGIQYSQYFKPEFDLRYYQYINKHSTMVWRISPAIGIPYKNSNVLPYEESFWGGGPNDLRAFRTRKLGPGGFDEDDKVLRNGEIKLISNIEYRFDIVDFLKGAAFIDAGNVWLKNEDSAKPNAHFDTSRFLEEIAIGTGIGLRWDFTYFIFRLDGAIKVRDPSNVDADRWVIGNAKPKDVNLNIGIGYPF
ncbi:MAG: BamA/TamA family outer membrane protein [Bacteroidia bacterium]|nr:BamA/TamA family outer membrane protein [Bacteroidia bacterium]